MRYPEDKIKEAILRPGRDVALRALGYFVESYSQDPTLMSLVIQANEMYGSGIADHLIREADDLRQSAESIAWVVDKLTLDADWHGHLDYLFDLLFKADIQLVVPHRPTLISAGFLDDDDQFFERRVQLSTFDQAACWSEFHMLGENAVEEGYLDPDEGDAIIEALARFGGAIEQTVLDLLAKDFDDDDAVGYLQPLVIVLAGRAQLASAVSPLVTKLRHAAETEDESDVDDYDDDAPHERRLVSPCIDALIRIGSPEVWRLRPPSSERPGPRLVVLAGAAAMRSQRPGGQALSRLVQ